MALSDLVPQIWARRFLSVLVNNLVYGARANQNYIGHISQMGNTVKVPINNTTITVGDYTKGQDINAAEKTDGATVDLVINKQKYYHFGVEDIDGKQSAPGLVSGGMLKAGIALAEQVDGDVKAVFDTAAKAQTAGTHKVQVDKKSSDSDFGPNFLRAVTKLKRLMTAAKIPLEGRWMVINGETIEGLENYFTNTGNANAIFTPNTSEATLTKGFSGNLYGFDLYTTQLTADLEISSTDYWNLIAGQGNEAVSHAMQIVQAESYRPHLRFATNYKGLSVYGTKALLPARLFSIQHQKA